jgi:hypothetical protein
MGMIADKLPRTFDRGTMCSIGHSRLPLREWFQKIEDGRPIRGTDFETAHEDVEILLMKVVDNWYGAGFKDGVAEEKASWEYNNA